MVCAWQSTGFHNAAARGVYPVFDERSQALTYQAENGGSPAHLWTDRFSGAPYYAPYEYYQNTAQERAYDAIVNNNGNPSGRTAVVEAFAATALRGAGDVELTLDYVNDIFEEMKTYALQMPVGSTVKGIVGYEGAWSPDYVNPSYNYPTSATNAATCTLTIPPTVNEALGITRRDAHVFNGLPETAGMAITPESVVGLDELCLKGGWGVTFTGGGSPDIITDSANTLWVGATVWPYTNDGNGLPVELTFGNRYFVVYKSGTTIRISATKGGAAINLSTPVFLGAGKSLNLGHESTVTFPGGGSANINVDTGVGFPSHFFSVDDVVVPGNTGGENLPMYTALPSEIACGKAYYVVATPSNTTFQISETKGGAAITFATANSLSKTTFRRGWKVLSVDKANRQLVIDRDTTGLGTLTSATIEWTYSNMMMNSLFYATKDASNTGVANDQMYQIWTDLHDPPTFYMEWPSNFVLFGSFSVWPVLDPGYFAPDTPQSLSIKNYN
jgi:hypothetical protein